MSRTYYDRKKVRLIHSDGREEETWLLSKELTDSGTLIRVSGQYCYLISSFTDNPPIEIVQMIEL